jgi:hypothetical protein
MMSVSSVKKLSITGRRHPSKYMTCRSQTTTFTVAAQPTVNPRLYSSFFFYLSSCSLGC